MPVPFLWLCCVKHRCFISTLISALLMETAVSKTLPLLSCEKWQIQLLKLMADILLRGLGACPRKNAPLQNAYSKHGKRPPCAEGFLALFEQGAITLFHLSSGKCYGVDRGVSSGFKCWEEPGVKALALQCHTDMAIFFFMVDLAQLVNTRGFLLRALLSNMARRWSKWQLHLIPVRTAGGTTGFARCAVWGRLHLLHGKQVTVAQDGKVSLSTEVLKNPEG